MKCPIIGFGCYRRKVALFTRAWIEINANEQIRTAVLVALFTRAWIEMELESEVKKRENCRPLHEGVD